LASYSHHPLLYFTNIIPLNSFGSLASPLLHQNCSSHLLRCPAQDLNHSDKNSYVGHGGGGGSSGRGLRHSKKYKVLATPLQMIHFKRVILDEAQRIDTPTAKTSQMALRIEADCRWCVTGTPLGKGRMDDLYGLLVFLRLNPVSGEREKTSKTRFLN